MSKEKRKFIRFECLFPAEVVKIEGKKGMAKEIKVNNISREGLRLVLSFDFSPGSDIDMSIVIPGKRASALVSGEIVWSRWKEDKWELGVRIKDIDKGAKSELLDLSYAKWLTKMEKKTREKKL